VETGPVLSYQIEVSPMAYVLETQSWNAGRVAVALGTVCAVYQIKEFNPIFGNATLYCKGCKPLSIEMTYDVVVEHLREFGRKVWESGAGLAVVLDQVVRVSDENTPRTVIFHFGNEIEPSIATGCDYDTVVLDLKRL